MNRRPRRNHTPAFKAKVALAAIKGDRTLTQLAEQFDVPGWSQQVTDVQEYLPWHSYTMASLPSGTNPSLLGIDVDIGLLGQVVEVNGHVGIDTNGDGLIDIDLGIVVGGGLGGHGTSTGGDGTSTGGRRHFNGRGWDLNRRGWDLNRWQRHFDRR